MAASEALQSLSTTIDWNRLPNGNSHCSLKDSTRVRRIATAVFGMGSIGSGAYAGFLAYSAYAFVAVPIATTAITALAVLCLALAIAAWRITCLKPSLNDPSERLKIRQQAGKEIESQRNSPTYGYDQIRKKYQSKKYWHSIITNDEINILIASDAQTMSYINFKTKHGTRVIGILNEQNLLHVKTAFYKYLEEECYGKKTLAEIQAMPEYMSLGIQEILIAEPIAKAELARLIQNQGTYIDFVRRLKPEAVTWVRDPAAKQQLTDKFVTYIDSLAIGTFELKIHNKHALEAFEERVNEDLCQRIIKKEVIRSKGDYRSLRERNGFQYIKEYAEANADIYAQLRRDFLNQDDFFLVAKQFKEDREFFKISQSDLKAVLSERWSATPIDELLKAQAFNMSLEPERGIFEARDWTDKALKDTAQRTIRDIGERYPELFTRGFLKWNDAIAREGDERPWSIRERLDSELAHIKNFRELRSYPKCLFECEILTGECPQVERLVSGYLVNNLIKYLSNKQSEESWGGIAIKTEDKLLNFLNNYPSLISRQIAQGPLDRAYQEYRKAWFAHQDELAQSAKQFNADVALIKKPKDNRISRLKSQMDLSQQQIASKIENKDDQIDQSLSQEMALKFVEIREITRTFESKKAIYQMEFEERNREIDERYLAAKGTIISAFTEAVSVTHV